MFNGMYYQFADKPDSLLFNLFVAFFFTSLFLESVFVLVDD